MNKTTIFELTFSERDNTSTEKTRTWKEYFSTEKEARERIAAIKHFNESCFGGRTSDFSLACSINPTSMELTQADADYLLALSGTSSSTTTQSGAFVKAVANGNSTVVQTAAKETTADAPTSKVDSDQAFVLRSKITALEADSKLLKAEAQVANKRLAELGALFERRVKWIKENGTEWSTKDMAYVPSEDQASEIDFLTKVVKKFSLK